MIALFAEQEHRGNQDGFEIAAVDLLAILDRANLAVEDRYFLLLAAEYHEVSLIHGQATVLTAFESG